MFREFMERIYENIGGKIKSLAKWVCIICSGLYIISALLYIILGAATGHFGWILVGVLAGVLGPLLIWIGTWTTYAFGDLVEKANDISQGINSLNRLLRNQQNNPQPPVSVEPQQPAAPVLKTAPKSEEKSPAAPAQEKPKEAPAPEKPKIAPAPESPLAEKLEFALSHRTNTGMIGYLRRLEDPEVVEILRRPEVQIRAGIEALVKKLKSE